MNPIIRSTLLAVLAALAAAVNTQAQAQALADPTRPPPMLMQPGTAGMVPAAPATPQLQSVLIGGQAGGRQVAVIDGETVRLGQMYKGARLVRMSETEVELLRGRERQVLKLFARSAPVASPAGQR